MNCHRGLTLIELLAALAVMAMMALMSWRGIDAMTRTQSHVQQFSNGLHGLQLALAQWKTDLDALVDVGERDPVAFDGRALTLVRHAADAQLRNSGVRIVVWTRFAGSGAAPASWVRWQSSAALTPFELFEALSRSEEWMVAGADPARTDARDSALRLVAAVDWRLYYYRNNSWANPLSSDVSAAGEGVAHAASSTPDAIRLELALAPGHGTITKEWINPGLAKAKAKAVQ